MKNTQKLKSCHFCVARKAKNKFNCKRLLIAVLLLFRVGNSQIAFKERLIVENNDLRQINSSAEKIAAIQRLVRSRFNILKNHSSRSMDIIEVNGH